MQAHPAIGYLWIHRVFEVCEVAPHLPQLRWTALLWQHGLIVPILRAQRPFYS